MKWMVFKIRNRRKNQSMKKTRKLNRRGGFIYLFLMLGIFFICLTVNYQLSLGMLFPIVGCFAAIGPTLGESYNRITFWKEIK